MSVRLDLKQYAKQGLAWALPILAGGTGRTDALARGVYHEVYNGSGAAIDKGMALRIANPGFGYAPLVAVAPTDATLDKMVGVAMADIATGANGLMQVVGPVDVLIEGAVTAGDLLYPTTVDGALSNDDVGGQAVAKAREDGTDGTLILCDPIIGAVETSSYRTAVLTFTIDGGGLPITTGHKADLVVDFNCYIEQVTLLAAQSGSIVIDLWKDTYGNYPPVVGDTITASAKPTLSAATKYQSSTLTGWTRAINAGDIIRLNVDSVLTIRRIVLAVKVRRT
jgi:hypothetical protein